MFWTKNKIFLRADQRMLAVDLPQHCLMLMLCLLRSGIQHWTDFICLEIEWSVNYVDSCQTWPWKAVATLRQAVSLIEMSSSSTQWWSDVMLIVLLMQLLDDVNKCKETYECRLAKLVQDRIRYEAMTRKGLHYASCTVCLILITVLLPHNALQSTVMPW